MCSYHNEPALSQSSNNTMCTDQTTTSNDYNVESSYLFFLQYRREFADPFWNSQKEGMMTYVFGLMTSWAMVCEVYHLKPTTIMVTQFASFYGLKFYESYIICMSHVLATFSCSLQLVLTGGGCVDSAIGFCHFLLTTRTHSMAL